MLEKKLMCKRCKKKSLVVVREATKEALEIAYKKMEKIFGDTPCSDCESPEVFAQKIIDGKVK